MKTLTTDSWHGANQRYLSEALARVREILDAQVARLQGSAEAEAVEGTRREDLQELASGMSAPPALMRLCKAFGLSPFERDVLLLCAGVELDAKFSQLCAAIQGNPNRTHPTFSLALAVLPGAHWSALTRASPLRRWSLIAVGQGDTLTTSPLSIDERVLHYLTGLSYIDERLQSLISLVPTPSELPESHRNLARRIADTWSRSGRDFSPIIQLCGDENAGKRDIVASACDILGLQLHAIRGADIPNTVTDREMLARLWERESVLSVGALLVDCDDTEVGDYGRSVLPFLDSMHTPLIVVSREPLSAGRHAAIRFDAKKPSTAEQRALWREALGRIGGELNEGIEHVVAQFDLSVEGIRTASAVLLGQLSTIQGNQLGHLLWDACSAQMRPRLESLAQRIEPAVTWNDLVLPHPQLQILHNIAVHCRQRTRVYETWGFAAKVSRGLGISALFVGASGTGKTMAAEVLANELRLDLYRIDLSQVVSKYIGETEKNLRRVFDAVEGGGAILLFDEADALFGKRSEVKDSHDRYANIEVSYLLQRMEAYRGLAILTTNMKEALDPAFIRRIRFIVHFPFPDAGQRAEIWRRIFPSNTPTEDLDIDKLAHLNVAGGNVRNIAMNAAFLAADADEPVRMAHLLQATRVEYAKLEKPLTEPEIGGWV